MEVPVPVTADRWIVHKFGGSSLADADCFRHVAAIVEGLKPPRIALVLSACPNSMRA